MEKSPITLNDNVEFLYEIDSKKVIDLYKKEFNISVERFFDNKTIKFYKCKTTDLKFVGGMPKIAGDGLFYEELVPKSGSYYNNEKWEFDAVLGKLNKNLKVLDVGCGDGHFLDKLSAKGIDGTGLELNRNAIDICLKKGLTVHEQRIEDFALKNANAFDVVCSFQVFEHLSSPNSVLDASVNLLAPGGLLIISVPNNESNIFKLDPYHTLNLPPHHVLFWDQNSLEKVAKFLNLEVVEILKAPIAGVTRGHLYKLILQKYFAPTISIMLFKTTNWFAKRIIKYVIKNKDGATVIAILKKKK